MRESVAIIGGGVAGLSAAHELVERGFDVRVYERRPFFGGKAASYRLASTSGQKAGLPGEHGFRFFPAWYRHLADTMERTPFRLQGGGRKSVLDNLVSVESNLLAWTGRPPVELPIQLPRSKSDVAMVTRFVTEFNRLGLGPGEIALFMGKMLEFLALPDEMRAERFESISWWQFLECDHPERSAAYKDLVRATTLTMVAAKAEEASAYTVGRLAARTFLDTLTSIDRVLNGPTNEVWIDPWIDHLTGSGVTFSSGRELMALEFDGKSRRIKRVVVERVLAACARRLRRFISRMPPDLIPDEKQESQLMAVMKPFMTSWEGILPDGDAREIQRDSFRTCQDLMQDARAGSRIPDRYLGTAEARQKLQAELTEIERKAGEGELVEADYFVLALPLEQLAYYVNRSAMLTHLAPELRKVVHLANHMDWMSGIQFYLSSPCDVAAGHIVGLDSAWALTAIEQTQFWKDIQLPDGVKSILSVDISAWDRPGTRVHKPAFNCGKAELAVEVWAQLQQLLNKASRSDRLRDNMLVGGALVDGVSYHIDESIVDLQDRKKQAFYERARGVRFNTFDLLRQTEEDGGDTHDYMWGPRLLFNAEPLLINRAGSRKLRPEATTSITNLFLAGDFVKTETDLACMEGANEAARRAVNGILDASASRHPRCQLWPFSTSRGIGDALRGLIRMFRGVESAARSVASVQSRLWSGLTEGLSRMRDNSRAASGDYLNRR